MRALLATKFGGDAPLANLGFADRPDPTPNPGQVRVRVRAASLNHHDLWTLKGVLAYPIEPPKILGCDASGVVDAYGGTPPPGAPAVGSDVAVYPITSCGECSECRRGDALLCRRFMMLSDGDVEGTFADFVIVPARNVVPKPASLSHEETACMGTAYLTAYRMLFTKAALRPGSTVLVQGAGGGLATAAIQLASAAGAFVIASSRSEEKLARAKTIGAREGVIAGREAARAIATLTGGDGVDAVIESVGEPTWGTSLRAVRPGGAVVVAGATGGANPPAELNRIFWRQLRILGSTEGSMDEFIALLRFMETRKMKPVIDRVYPFDQAREAFERLASGDHFGKLVIRM